MNRSGLSNNLRAVLDNYRVRWRAVNAAIGVILTLCVIVGGAGLCVLVDRALLGAPRPLRVAFLAAIIASAVYLVLRRVVVPISRRMSDERTAARLGEHFPDAAEDLLTGVELNRPEDAAGVSKGLIAAALSEIDERAGAIRYRAALPLAILQKAAAVLALLAIGVVAGLVLAPDAVWNGIERLVRPDRDVAFFSYTRLKIVPGDCFIRQGDPVRVQFTVEGSRVGKGWLDVRPAASGERRRTESFTLELPVAGGKAEWQSGPLSEDLTYRVRAGDAHSPWFNVRAVAAPSLSSKSVRIRLPAYTARPEPITVPAMSAVSVLQGSTVVIRVRPVHRGDDPRLTCSAVLSDGKTDVPFTAEASGDLVTPPLAPAASADYKILLTDGLGLTARAPDTISLKLVPDELPVVVVSKPGADVTVLPNEVVHVALSAQDDYGCRELNLRSRVVRGTAKGAKSPGEAGEGKWEVAPIKQGGPTVTRLDGELDLSPSELGLAAGDRIEYEGESSDFEDDAIFRKARSPMYRIAVLSYSEHLMGLFNRLKELSRDLTVAAARQKAEAEQTGKLSESPPGNAREAAGQAGAAQEREAELRRSVAQISKEISAAMMEMARNPEAMSSLLAEVDRLGRETQETSDQPMKSAEQSLAKAGESGKSGQSGQPSQSGESSQSQSSQSQPGQSGKPGQSGQPGKPSPSGQKGPSSNPQEDLKKAQDEQQQAADDLERLAAELRRLERRKMLDLLADAAEKLGKDQQDNRELTAQTGVALNGRPASELSPDDRAKLQRVVADQKQIASGVGTLKQDVEKALRVLTGEEASEADRASDALDKMRTDKTVEDSAAVAERLAQGTLFAQLPKETALANSLDDVADILRTSDDMEGLSKQLQEFIKRQKALNGAMEKLNAGDLKGADPLEPKLKTPAPGSNGRPQNAPAQNVRVLRMQGGGFAVGARQGAGAAAPPPAPGSGGTNPPGASGQQPAPEETKAVSGRLGVREATLGQDVSEQSLAMRDLLKQFGLFKPETADKLDAAAQEMNQATQELNTPAPPPALEHGRKALALLEDAAKKLPEDEQQANSQPNPNSMDTETLMLLAKILGGQKQVNSDTSATDRAKMEVPATLADRIMGLARRQNRLRFDADRLVRKLAEMPQAAAVVNTAGGKMDTSRKNLEAGDTGQETRVAQREAVALLEQLLKDQQRSGSASAAAAAAMAMMAGGGGGFTGGSNGPLMPATLEAADNDAWAKMRSQYDGKTGSGFDAQYPAEFRGLLNSYFDQVRKESKP